MHIICHLERQCRRVSGGWRGQYLTLAWLTGLGQRLVLERQNDRPFSCPTYPKWRGKGSSERQIWASRVGQKQWGVNLSRKTCFSAVLRGRSWAAGPSCQDTRDHRCKRDDTKRLIWWGVMGPSQKSLAETRPFSGCGLKMTSFHFWTALNKLFVVIAKDPLCVRQRLRLAVLMTTVQLEYSNQF